LNHLDSRPEKQVITGRQKRIGNDFRYQRGSGANEARYRFTICSYQQPQPGHPTRIQSQRNGGTSRPRGLMRQGRKAPTKRATAGGGESGPFPAKCPRSPLRRFRTLAEVRRRGRVPRIADVRRDEHIVRDVPRTVVVYLSLRCKAAYIFPVQCLDRKSPR
jgi:hypothetical protein